MLRSTILAVILVSSSLLGVGSFAAASAASSASDPSPIVRQWDGFQSIEGGGIAVEEPIIWSLVAIAAGCIVAATLYLLKREVGGFPENPDWVAPITIMPAGENAVDESDFPPPPADHH
ncbi:MAG: hypothetical protein KC482_16975 [Dehalococcoidia bacterium]|nr:hypothetical protein [Dehalococcoidia bacterium]MCA9844259.1 hypothetical protein [Dehalococcoidia bacterium]MCA9855249.1 hypothetical protein [Dehalococcoidia bacterium]